MIEKMLKDKLLETKLLMSHVRRKEIRKYLDYYSGVDTEQYIGSYFSGDAFQEIPPSVTNFTRKFINKISRIYSLCLLYTSPSPRDATLSRMPSSA